MNKRIRFFQSVHFKIALVFVLLLMISIEIIGAIFIRELENNILTTFKNNTNHQVETLATNLSNELVKNSDDDNKNLQRVLADFSKSDILEARIVDDKGIVRGTSDGNKRNVVGKKNDYEYGLLGETTQKREEVRDAATGRRIYRIVQQVYSNTGDSVIGILYVKSDIESKYQEVSDIVNVFFTASLIAIVVSLIVAVLVARTITKPIGEMKKQAIRVAQGDYSGKVKVYGQDELGQLGETLNELSERIEEAQDSKEAERHRLDSVLSHMTDGVIGTDRRGKITLINETALLLLGTTEEESLGHSILDVLKVSDSYTLRELLEKKDELILDLSESFDERLILKAEFSMIRRESGFITGLVCVLHDITEQEKIAQERRDFVSNVSHELRTPLTSMRSYLEALIDGAWKDPEVAPNFLKVTQDETDRMIRMITDLLNLSRMDNEAAPLQMELVNLNEMLNFILDRFDMMIKNNNQKYVIKREFTKRSIWVDLDEDKMIQVFDNIMNNALKYSPQGGVITCRMLETHNHVIISFSDQGLGIPKRDLRKIFERFYRVDKARSRAMGGSGLGLAISREVVKQHGGSIWVESKEGEGSTFFISLPYEPYEEDLWDEMDE